MRNRDVYTYTCVITLYSCDLAADVRNRVENANPDILLSVAFAMFITLQER